MENKTQYKVIAVQENGGPDRALGVHDTLEEAQKRVREVHDRGHMVYYTRLDIIAVEESVVEISWSEPDVVPDYERQGVQTVTADYEKLRDTVHHLEDRHVGLRHELSADMEMLEDSFEELKDELSEKIDNLDVDVDNLDESMRHEVAGLQRDIEEMQRDAGFDRSLLYVMRNEMTDLTKELEELRGRTQVGSSERRSGGPRQQENRRHEERERQQQKNKEETEKWKS